ncbi:hypothetical protein FOXG_08511 [Fusarium oxysporum f. sp. lycopersici 4287]|uniref:Methyltransferase domain-containing protein n=2 Tax=Fusarium oxysporum TaxID=5507 RepID=A0A0J9WNH5_FUSO4|nr:hypothetical protein FOXG_08511 [Fusarium oxysporum f. sp. lycopersici 4287]KNB07292.1 hypothetical protein FOXG_08511 [Fusarium oxysporum f. sp. lycopersici 4287]
MQRDGTVPLDETFTETIEHYGRSYQHYSLTNGTYFAPIDEDEISRLEVMHGVLSRLFDGRLIFPPIRSPRRILDCGCGPGDWAIEVATQYPDAELDEKRRFYGSRVETLDVANVRLVECSSEERSQQPSIQGLLSRKATTVTAIKSHFEPLRHASVNREILCGQGL